MRSARIPWSPVPLGEVFLFHVVFTEACKVGYNHGGKPGTTVRPPVTITDDAGGEAILRLCEVPCRVLCFHVPNSREQQGAGDSPIPRFNVPRVCHFPSGHRLLAQNQRA